MKQFALHILLSLALVALSVSISAAVSRCFRPPSIPQCQPAPVPICRGTYDTAGALCIGCHRELQNAVARSVPHINSPLLCIGCHGENWRLA